MIKVKSYFSDDVIDTIDYSGNLGCFFDEINPDWRLLKGVNASLFLNGDPVFLFELDSITLKDSDSFEIYIDPKGGIVSGIGKLLGGVLGFAFGFLLPSSRSTNHNRVNTPQGQRLEASDIKVNQPRLGAVVPEGFGRYRRFMDNVTEIRRYFVDKRQQEVEALLCVGVGDYLVESMKVGDTDISAMDNTEYFQFAPNQDVGRFAEVWHTVKEVGATSSGTAGLDLSMEIIRGEDIDDTQPVGGYIFSGNTIRRADGTPFNIDLSVSDDVRIRLPLEYTHNTIAIRYGDREFLSTIVSGTFSHAKVNGKIIPSHGAEEIYDDTYNGYYWRTYKEAVPGYPGSWSITGAILNPRNGVTTEAWGESKSWKITEINGDTITVSDGQGGYFPDVTSSIAKLDYEISPEIHRGAVTNSFTATPVGVNTGQIEIDFFFPQGLCYVGDDGNLYSENASIEVSIIDLDNPSFGVVHTFSYTDNTNDQIGFTENINLPYSMTPSVSMRRVGSINNSVQSHSQVTWYGLKSRMPDVRRYEKWTTMGIRIQSGGKLSAQSETSINAIITRKLPELQSDGSWSEPRPTRDIASCVRYIAHEIGYTDSNIDMTEVLYLHNNFWKPRNETFDYIFDETTVKSAIETAFNAGLSDLTVANGKIKPVRDDVRTDIEQSYSAQNIIGNITQSFKTKDSGRFDGVELEYVDDSTFDKKVITCSLPNSEKKKLRKVSLRGVTSELRAWRIGMRLASEDRYINKDFSFKTEMDAFNSEYGSYIAIIDDVPNYGQSSQILEVGSDYIVISEDPNLDSTVLAWRDRFGKYHGDYPINKIEGRKIYVNLPIKPLISLNFELPHAYLGNSDRISHRCVVDEILPNSTQDATIKASIYDERVYAYDNSEII